MTLIEMMRCSCRRMAHIIENRDRMEGGTSQSPRMRTSRVPWSILDHGYIFRIGICILPSRASSKQCCGSQWLVKMMTLWPRFCNPTAASTISLSAPPIPRSGWKNAMVFLLGDCDMASHRGVPQQPVQDSSAARTTLLTMVPASR